MSLFRRETRQFGPEPVIAPIPGTSVYSGSAGGSPSISSALQVSAVWACVRLVADSVSMMPVSAFKWDGAVRVPIPAPPLLLHPSNDTTMSEWVYMLIVSLMLRGNAYGHIVSRGAGQYPTQVEWYSPDDVKPRTNSRGKFVYTVNGKEIPSEDIMHVRAYRMPGSRMGLSPIDYAARHVQTDGAIQDFAFGFFRDGAHPSSLLSSDYDYNREQAQTIKQQFMAAVRGREPAVLSGGLTYSQIQVSPEESQFLATQKFGVASIARIFGVPPEMIAAEAGNSMTYANVEQRAIDFLTYSLQPWLTRIETAISQCLPGKNHVRFDTNVLLRTDMHTRMQATAVAIASHQMLPDEARALGDLPPFTQAQKEQADLVPMTVSPSGRPLALPGSAPAGLPPQAPAAAPATPAAAPAAKP